MNALEKDAASGLFFRIRPAAEQATARVFLLHGVGSNEENLVSVANALDHRLKVVAVRGPLVVGPHQFAWFQVRFGPQGPVINPEQAEASRLKLIALAQSLNEADRGQPVPTIMAGFSQGGIMSASVGLSAPGDVSRFAILSGRVLPEVAPHSSSPEQLSGTRALIMHGEQDDKLPVHFARQADAWLTQWGVAHTLRLYPAGHTLTAEMVNDFSHWLDERCQQR